MLPINIIFNTNMIDIIILFRDPIDKEQNNIELRIRLDMDYCRDELLTFLDR